MLTKILGPLDGLGLAERALTCATALAASRSDTPELLVPVDGSAFAEAALDIDAGLAEALHGRLAAKHPTLPTLTHNRVGQPSDGIEDALAQREAAPVVMATYGRSGAKRAIIGSIAGKIVQHASVPVVLLHPARAEDEPAVSMIPVEVIAR